MQSVPEGKKWKVTNFFSNNNFTQLLGNEILIGGTPVFASGGEYGLNSGIMPSSRDIATLADGAFWLSEGTNLAPGANTYGINVLEFNSSQSSESNSNSSSFSGTGVGVAQWIDYPAQAVSAYDNIGNLNSGGMDTWGDDTFFDNGGGFSVKSNSYFSGTQFDYNAYYYGNIYWVSNSSMSSNEPYLSAASDIYGYGTEVEVGTEFYREYENINSKNINILLKSFAGYNDIIIKIKCYDSFDNLIEVNYDHNIFFSSVNAANPLPNDLKFYTSRSIYSFDPDPSNTGFWIPASDIKMSTNTNISRMELIMTKRPGYAGNLVGFNGQVWITKFN